MKNKFQLLVISIFFTNVSFGQNLDFTNLIEKVSQQRMLCEQITKNYLLIGSKINVDQATIEFDEFKSAFAENLNLIANNLKSENSKNAMTNVKSLWTDLQLTVNLVPTKVSAIEILKKTNNLGLACKDLSSKIFVENNFKNSNLFNVFIKQKLNSQKIAKLWLANNWKIDYPNLDIELKEVMTSYEFSLSILIAATDKSTLMFKILNKENLDWQYFKKSFDLENTLVQPQTVLDNTNAILKALNNNTSFYQKIALQNAIVRL